MALHKPVTRCFTADEALRELRVVELVVDIIGNDTMTVVDLMI